MIQTGAYTVPFGLEEKLLFKGEFVSIQREEDGRTRGTQRESL
jgi:hypothetical protein